MPYARRVIDRAAIRPESARGSHTLSLSLSLSLLNAEREERKRIKEEEEQTRVMQRVRVVFDLSRVDPSIRLILTGSARHAFSVAR